MGLGGADNVETVNYLWKSKSSKTEIRKHATVTLWYIVETYETDMQNKYTMFYQLNSPLNTTVHNKAIIDNHSG